MNAIEYRLQKNRKNVRWKGTKCNLQDTIAQYEAQEKQITIITKTNKTTQQVKQLWERKGIVFPDSINNRRRDVSNEFGDP